jgi:hypothetical protein
VLLQQDSGRSSGGEEPASRAACTMPRGPPPGQDQEGFFAAAHADRLEAGGPRRRVPLQANLSDTGPGCQVHWYLASMLQDYLALGSDRSAPETTMPASAVGVLEERALRSWHPRGLNVKYAVSAIRADEWLSRRVDMRRHT